MKHRVKLTFRSGFLQKGKGRGQTVKSFRNGVKADVKLKCRGKGCKRQESAKIPKILLISQKKSLLDSVLPTNYWILLKNTENVPKLPT